MARDKRPTSRIVALLDGGEADEQVIELSCLLARQRQATLFLVRPIVVERSLPLDATMPEASAAAQAVLARARRTAERYSCDVETRELKTRDAAGALIDEAADLGCDLIVLGVAGEGHGANSPQVIAEQVMHQAPCPVWVYRQRPGH